MDHPTTLFVYGTLMPGHLRWPVIEPHALSWRPAAVEGTLYDTGSGWPTAHFHAGERLVRGWAVDLVPERVGPVLVHLDEVEDVADGLFRRVVVRLLGGDLAIAYEAGSRPEGLPVIEAWTDAEEA